MDKLRVLLISPQYGFLSQSIISTPPLGLVYLGTVIKKETRTVKILDAAVGTSQSVDGGYYVGMANEEVKTIITDFSPHIIGLGCQFSSKWDNLVEIAKLAKRIHPGCITVAGGIYPSMYTGDCLRTVPALDFCFIGEGETAFLKFISLVEQNQGTISEDTFLEIRGIEGLIYREGDQVRVNPKREYIENLDELPYPDYDLIIGGAEQYFRKDINTPLRLGERFLPILSSRSCPIQCSFCNMHITHGKKMRKRTAENVVGEMRYFHDKYGVDSFEFIDDNASLDRKRFIEINRGISRLGYKVKLAANNGLMINSLDEEVVRSMKEAGFRFVAIAVESADENIRKNVIGKPIDEKKICEVVSLLKKAKIFVCVYFITGFVEEDRGVVDRNIAMISKLQPNLIAVSALQLYPCTSLYDSYKERGFIPVDFATTHLRNELKVSNMELFPGYKEEVLKRKRLLFKAFILSLLSHPWDMFRFYDIYFDFGRILSNLKMYIDAAWGTKRD